MGTPCRSVRKERGAVELLPEGPGATAPNEPTESTAGDEGKDGPGVIRPCDDPRGVEWDDDEPRAPLASVRCTPAAAAYGLGGSDKDGGMLPTSCLSVEGVVAAAAMGAVMCM